MIPNYLEDVKAARVKYADAWSHAHISGDPRTLEWIKLFAKDLNAKDAKCALNGKRGDPKNLSADAINILCDAADSKGRTPEGLPCVVVDVIGGAGGPNPTPTWSVFDTLVEGSGAHVDPNALPQPPGPAYPPYPPNESDVDGAGIALFADFAQAGQAPNPQMFRFAFRVAYSWLTKEVPDLPASVNKHRREWRAILGLPPR